MNIGTSTTNPYTEYRYLYSPPSLLESESFLNTSNAVCIANANTAKSAPSIKIDVKNPTTSQKLMLLYALGTNKTLAGYHSNTTALPKSNSRSN